MFDISQFLPYYQDIKYNNFYNDTIKKKEFQELKSTKKEIINENLFTNAQNLIARFLSSYTPYNELLLVWSLGSGKTSAAISVIEHNKNISSNYTGAMIFTRNNILTDNFINEIIKIVYKKNKQILEENEYKNIKKQIYKYYKFYTFETFSKNTISALNDDILKQDFSNKIIIIDEAHNIRYKENKSEQDETIYKNFHRFLHIVENCKILLLSGTPIKDTIDEITSVMNLILPLNKQMPIGSTFINEYFTNTQIDNKNKYQLILEKKEELYNYFKGRVSYLKSITSDIHKNYIGNSCGKLNYFKVLCEKMEQHQTDAYKQALKKDTGDISTLYINSRQSSLFVFPDNTYGKTGFDNYVNVTKQNKYSLKQNIDINNLQKYSIKYYNLLQNIETQIKNKQLSFIYCEYVNGSGLVLLSLIMKKLGFEEYSFSKRQQQNKKTYALLTSNSKIQELLNVFNSTKNATGDYINVILGSRVIMEGITLKNVQNVHILTPHWNYSETEQAIARGYRFRSHEDLINLGIKPQFNIYQYVSITNDYPDTLSIDLYMYEIAEIKDVNSAQITKILKESAFDCFFNYERNFTPGYDNMRECNYTNCNYDCFGVNYDDENNNFDYLTYNLYYNNLNIQNIIKEIKQLYFIYNEINIDDSNGILKDLYNKYTKYDIYTSFFKIVNDNIIIINKFGFSSYLREDGLNFYLVNIPSTNSISLYDRIYNKNPYISKYQNITDMYRQIYKSYLKQIFNFKNDEIKNYKKFITNIIIFLPIKIQSLLFEYAIIAQLYKKDNIIEIIIDIFKNQYYYIDDKKIYLSFIENNYRCLDVSLFTSEKEWKKSGLIWKDCDDEFIKGYNDIKTDKIKLIQQNKVFGTYNGDKFCIIVNTVNEKADTRTKISGQECKSWNKKQLIYIIIYLLKINFDFIRDNNFNNLPNLDTILTPGIEVKKNLLLQKKIILYTDINKPPSNWKGENITKDDINNMDENEINLLLYFSQLQIKTLCEIIKYWLTINNLIYQDHNCGTAQKKKK